MPEERPRRTPHGNEQRKNSASGWQLIAVQSISCVVVILIAFAFRMVGGSAFTQLRESFNQSIMSNSILATLAALLDSPSTESEDESGASETTSTGSTTTNPTNSEEATTSANSAAGTSSATTGQITTQTTTGTTTSPTTKTVAAVGGKDIPVTQKKVLYAPDGATFVPLKINRLAYKPLESGTITSGFGYRENPTSGGDSFHQGLDIAAETGASISAMYFGVVREIGQNAGYGNYVRLYHGNGLEVLYAHCSEILVNKDAVIRAGEVVSRVGSTGDSTGPHLHIEITLHGVAYDPAGVVPTNDYA